jgi:hypothetical protein
MKLALKLLWIACGMFFTQQNLLANTYTVTSTADSGPGTLRQAILDANANPGADIIQFSIGTTGNLFEGSAPNTYAVIELNTALPTITDAVYINGTTQTNTNTGYIATQSVGVDNVNLSTIAYPDVYIVPSASFVFPSTSTGVNGNGLSIDAANVTIKGIAISGFGNTTSNPSQHSDISVLRSSVSRTINFAITDCFISCDPLGNLPSASQRKSKANSILVCGNNEMGILSNNYIAYSGTYAIHFNGNTDNLNVGPASTTVGNRNWQITGNRIKAITINTGLNPLVKSNDGITLMKCVSFQVKNNYISDVEQTGIDLGYNSDSNYISNNTITGITRTGAIAPQAGIRIGLCSEKDTLFRNAIYNNTGTSFKAGIWLDRSIINGQPGVIAKNNSDNVIEENQIFSNNSSGIVLSTYSTGGCYNTKISRNATYDNSGLGIDLDFSGTSGSTLVTTNDDGDVDGGPNNIQNFPIIDSVIILSSNQMAVYGKAPAGATVEFFITDGQVSTFGGRSLNYAQGKTFIGSGVEGSASDLRSGTASYNIDGNISSGDNLFYFILPYSGTLSTNSITATATIANNTSEFGPMVKALSTLNVTLQSFSAVYAGQKVKLQWQAETDNDFSNFELEHSLNGKDFSTLALIFSNVNNSTGYEFIHSNAQAGKHFYRLRMVNFSGKIQYSSILNVGVGNDNKESVAIANSVFVHQIDVKLNLNDKQVAKLWLLNGAGQIVKAEQKQAQKGINYMQVTGLDKLASGVYILVAETSNKTISQKLIKTN